MALDLYGELGVSRTATDDEIKKAYRKLARELHPDRNPDNKEAEERFKRVSAAYAVLSEKDKRKNYDEFGDVSLRSGFDPEAYRAYAASGSAGGGYENVHVDWSDFFGGGSRGSAGQSGFGFDFDIDELLQRVGMGRAGGGARGGRTRARRGTDFETEVQLTLQEAAVGTEREFSLKIPQTGETSTVKVRIPAGVESGSRVRVPSKGGEGSNGGPAGDLYLRVRVAEHPQFWRQGDALHVKLPVTPLELYQGAKVPVPTPLGIVQLQIPAGSQNGAKLRLKGRGVQRKNSPGDLYVHLDLRLPEEKSEELEAAYETIQKNFSDDVRAKLRW